MLCTEEREELKKYEEKEKKRLQREEEQLRKPLIEQWLDNYWDVHVSDTTNVIAMDQQVYKLVHHLLLVGDEQLQSMKDQPYKSSVTGKPLSHYESVKSNAHFKHDSIVHHERQIHSVMMTIKPGLCSICTKQFTKQMIYAYLEKIKNADVDQIKRQ